jgi:hypothetical protein
LFSNAAELQLGQAWDSSFASVAGRRSIWQGFCGAIDMWQLSAVQDGASAIVGRLRLACLDSFSPISAGAFPSSWSLAIYNMNQILFPRAQ